MAGEGLPGRAPLASGEGTTRKVTKAWVLNMVQDNAKTWPARAYSFQVPFDSGRTHGLFGPGKRERCELGERSLDPGIDRFQLLEDQAQGLGFQGAAIRVDGQGWGSNFREGTEESSFWRERPARFMSQPILQADGINLRL